MIAFLGVAACGDEDRGPTSPTAPAWAKLAPEQIAEARKQGVPVAFENEVGMRFVLIPSGTFLMGSPKDEEGREGIESQHRVTITAPFYLQTTEVTNEQYRRWKSRHVSGAWGAHSLDGDEQPVAVVRWEDAMGFAAWLTGNTREYTYDLPTEAEWEYACRAGTRTTFSCGEELGVLARHANISDRNDPTGALEEGLDDGHAVTAPVGSYPPNPWGLHDMHGNVWEWCSDWYGQYPLDPVTDPSGPVAGDVKVHRGGSWRWFPAFSRCAARRWYPFEPDLKDYGFRLVARPRARRSTTGR